jgi:hypothetical protein
MILSVHATFGAAIASLVPSHPLIGFGLGFASHFILDAIPHRDYELISVEKGGEGKVNAINFITNKLKVIRDVSLASLDGIVGICLSFLLFFNPLYPWSFLLGAIGGLTPDIIVFMFLILQHKSLNLFFSFHSSFDSKLNKKLKQKIGQITGVGLQFFTAVVLLAIVFGIKSFW